jgi:hypothetical protein
MTVQKLAFSTISLRNTIQELKSDLTSTQDVAPYRDCHDTIKLQAISDRMDNGDLITQRTPEERNVSQRPCSCGHLHSDYR